MAKISVMMAAYNTEAYIRRALESLQAQTLRDFDVIVVDDGSTDGTGAIADSFAAADSRIHVLHQSNSGVCVTRNNCIDWTYAHSDSQWILFADSDDWLHPEMLERLLGAAEENQVLVAACGYGETTGADPVIDPKDLEPVVWDTMAFYQASYVNAIMTCCKLYHKSLYRDIRHPTDNYFDDEFVSYKMLYQAKKMAVIPAPLYAYFINTSGLTKRPWAPKLLDAWVAYEEQIAFFREKGEEELVSFRLRGYLENAVANYRAACQAEDTPEIHRARLRIRRKIREVLKRMEKQGCLHPKYDFDTLLEFCPVKTRAARFWREKLGGQGNA